MCLYYCILLADFPEPCSRGGTGSGHLCLFVRILCMSIGAGKALFSLFVICAARVCVCAAGYVCVCVCVLSVYVFSCWGHMFSLDICWTLGTRTHSSLTSIRLPSPATSNMGYTNLQTDLVHNTVKKKGVFLQQVNLM